MSRWQSISLKALFTIALSAGVVVAGLILKRPDRPRETLTILKDWLGERYQRVTGQSVEIRTDPKSRRCAQTIVSTFNAARAAGGPLEPFEPVRTSPDLMDRIHDDAKHSPPAGAPATNDRTGFYIDVFSTPEAKPGLLDGTSVFPVGSTILKRKSFGADGQGTEYFTGMRKRRPAFFLAWETGSSSCSMLWEIRCSQAG
jgi:hypothetical protein